MVGRRAQWTERTVPQVTHARSTQQRRVGKRRTQRAQKVHLRGERGSTTVECRGAHSTASCPLSVLVLCPALLRPSLLSLLQFRSSPLQQLRGARRIDRDFSDRCPASASRRWTSACAERRARCLAPSSARRCRTAGRAEAGRQVSCWPRPFVLRLHSDQALRCCLLCLPFFLLPGPARVQDQVRSVVIKHGDLLCDHHDCSGRDGLHLVRSEG